MNRGQHRKPNAVMEFLKKKPIQLLGIGALALSVVAVSLPHSSYAAPSLTNYGTGYPAGAAGTPNGTGGISGGQTLYPKKVSPELPVTWQGSNGKNVADGSFFLDHWGKIVGPSGQNANAYSLHFDVDHTSTGQQLTGNNGYEDIMASVIDDWIANVDGYTGSGNAQEQAFDQFLKNEVMADYALWATNRYGSGQFTVYDLPNLIQDAGGAFSGQYVGPYVYTGPKFYWTYAPHCKVSVPSGQTIKPGSTFNFDGEAAIMTYHSVFHWEWAQVVDSNGQIVPGAKVTFANNKGLGGGVSGNGVYLDPTQPSPNTQMTEVNGGTTTPGNVAPKWFYWNDGNGEPTYGAVTPSQHDTITLPNNIANGTYTIQYYVSDYYNRVSGMTTATFTVGNGSNSGITLDVNGSTSANVATGTAVTLNAKVTAVPKAGDTYHIQIRDMGGSTINGSSQANSGNNQTTFSTNANSQTAVTENYTAYLVDTTTGNSVASNQVTVTWSTGPPPPPPGGGQCPAPYDKNEYWQSNGNGNETFYWTYDEPYPVYQTVQRCSGTGKNRTCWNVQVFVRCDDKLTQMSQYYPATENQGKISGLSYDPGTPGNMWLPIPAGQWGQDTFWQPIKQQHGWDGFEGGGPNASQISGTTYINGQQYHTWGPGQGSTPWAWARPASSFGFKMLWTGSSHSLPTSGTVTFTLKNPDGASRTWSEKLIINSETLQTQGTQMMGLNQPPPPADEVYSCAVEMIPKTVGSNNELAAWSLSSNVGTALANGAHINVTISINTQNAGTITVNVPTMVALFNYPAWFFNQTGSVTIGGTTYTGTGPAQDGQ